LKLSRRRIGGAVQTLVSRHESGVQLGVEAAGDAEDAVWGGEVDHLGVLEDVDA